MRNLKQADSFNSSGATIVPEVVSRTDARAHGQRQPPSGTGAGPRMIASQDSIGREFDAAYGAGDDGMIRLLQGQGDGSGPWDFFVTSDESPGLNFPSQGSFSLEPTLLSPDPAPVPTSTTSFSHPTTSPPLLQTIHFDSASASASPFAPSPVSGPDYRPPSAHSFHSHRTGQSHRDSVSGSEYSFSATDVSEDQDVNMGMDGMGGDALTELNLAGMELGEAGMGWNAAGFSAQHGHGGVTVGHALVRKMGPVRGIGGLEDEDDTKRKDRLEHRRSINRKSAQKHRARRKEELETLTRTIADRDARIAQLEKELAVERAKFQQMVSFVREHTSFAGRGGRDGRRGQGGLGGGDPDDEAEGEAEEGAAPEPKAVGARAAPMAQRRKSGRLRENPGASG